MQKLKHDKKKKEYQGVALNLKPPWLDSEIFVIAPDQEVLNEFYKHVIGIAGCDPKLCKRVKVTEG